MYAHASAVEIGVPGSWPVASLMAAATRAQASAETRERTAGGRPSAAWNMESTTHMLPKPSLAMPPAKPGSIRRPAGIAGPGKTQRCLKSLLLLPPSHHSFYNTPANWCFQLVLSRSLCHINHLLIELPVVYLVCLWVLVHSSMLKSYVLCNIL